MEPKKKTNGEILAAINKKAVYIWDNPNRPGTTQSDECEYCGKKVGKDSLYVHINTRGIILPNGITEADLEQVDMESQGCFPLGTGCAEKLFGDEIDEYTFRYSDIKKKGKK